MLTPGCLFNLRVCEGTPHIKQPQVLYSGVYLFCGDVLTFSEDCGTYVILLPCSAEHVVAPAMMPVTIPSVFSSPWHPE